MAHVIGFPLGQKLKADANRPLPTEPGIVIILPVIRVERRPDKPSDGVEASGRGTNSRRRRRRARS